MNKDSIGLSEYERFNLFLSAPGVERELQKIKKPVVNIEPIPKTPKPVPDKMSVGTKPSKKDGISGKRNEKKKELQTSQVD